jgi:hypothetical protein
MHLALFFIIMKDLTKDLKERSTGKSRKKLNSVLSPECWAKSQHKDSRQTKQKQNKLRGLSPQANYINRATAPCRRS